MKSLGCLVVIALFLAVASPSVHGMSAIRDSDDFDSAIEQHFDLDLESDVDDADSSDGDLDNYDSSDGEEDLEEGPQKITVKQVKVRYLSKKERKNFAVMEVIKGRSGCDGKVCTETRDGFMPVKLRYKKSIGRQALKMLRSEGKSACNNSAHYRWNDAKMFDYVVGPPTGLTIATSGEIPLAAQEQYRFGRFDIGTHKAYGCAYVKCLTNWEYAQLSKPISVRHFVYICKFQRK